MAGTRTPGERERVGGGRVDGDVRPEGMPDMGSAPAVVAYEQLCLSYRAIDDFRAKLLALLPLASGGLCALITGGSWSPDRGLLTPLGTFGAAVTAGLLAHELHGIRKCRTLIRCGRELEEAVVPAGIGQFRARSDDSLLGKPTASAIIYPAVFAAWAFIALLPVSVWVAAVVGVLSALVGFTGVRRYARAYQP
jgi:hypothetical protein